VASGKGIPPFLILHVAATPETTAQAKRLEAVLRASDLSVKVYGALDSTHDKINQGIGLADDPTTTEIKRFLELALEQTAKP